MPKELITERRDHAGNQPISAVLVTWGQSQEHIQIGATLDCRSQPHDRDYIFATLNDREGCNALIRAVRKARDQAFGADA